MKHIIYVLLFALAFTGCTEDFQEINTNENAPTEVQPELLLRQVLYGYGDDMGYESFVAGNLLSQHLAMIDFNLFDRHALNSPQEGGNPWDIFYQHLRDNETILTISREDPTAAVYEGPALILKAYLAMNLTDLFGDVPYSEAVRGREGIVNPSYDSQEDIYLGENGILANLSAGRRAIESYEGVLPLNGDILYAGDLDQWLKFSRSLELKALLRISGRIDVSDLAQAVIAEGPLLETNEDNAVFRFTDGQPNNYPLANTRVGIFNVFLMSETAEAIFTELNDLRVEVLYRPAAITESFTGVANGIDAASAIVPDSFARPGMIWRENTGELDFNYLTAWETHFVLAELVARNLLTDNSAEAHYEQGVRLAFEYWNTPLNEDYLLAGPAAYDANNAIEQIITQKWIANMSNVYEGWTEWRRTGFPNLRPVAASLNDGLYPVRMPYPADEQALNLENYASAAQATEGNSVNTGVWWDVD
ncbi:SusD/RagB family nutrient-binding outer membrane lipoprotein [Lewinellaceae bacterium SD302]|nr:SusD/RagB family nutrient-binding outer membrane lipoprotein [Lewinellaceae bacterium SD302]